MKLKKALSLTLALVLSLAMAVPAFAAPVTLDSTDYTAAITISDATKSGTLTYTANDGNNYTIDLYEVPVGAKVSDPYGNGGMYVFIDRLDQKADGTFSLNESADAPEFNSSATFGAGTEGYWKILFGAIGFDTIAIHVGGSTAPTEPEKPTTPTEPEKPAEPVGDRFTTDKASTGTVTKEIDGKMETVRLYPEGTVFTWKGPSFNRGFGAVSIVGDRYLGSYFDTFTLKNDGIYYISIEGDVVYAMADSAQAGQPTTPVQPEQPATKTANPTNDKLVVNGVEKTPTVYKIGGSNYFQIRDVAAVLNGTEKQFSVGYSNGKVTATSGQPYDATGKELKGAPSSAKDASPSNDAIVIDGVETSLTVYKIGGSNYFKLRDLGKALDFNVGYSGGQVTIDTSKSYS